MKKITFPLKLGTKSPEVSNLQEALQLLLEKAIILQGDEAARQELSAGLQAERATQTFGDSSAKVVSIFQKEQNLKSSNIDKKTVNALNGLLQEKGLLPTAESTDTALDTRYTVLCCVVDSQGKPIAGLRVEAFDQDPKSPHDPLGEPATTDAGGMVLFRFKSSDFTEHPGEKGPDLYFKVYRKETLLAYSLPSILNDNGVIRGFQQQREPITIRVEKHYVVTGVIVQDNGQPAQNLDLFIYNLGFGGNATPLGSPTTNFQGFYSWTYDPGATVVNLELRIKDPKDSSKEIHLVKPRFAAKALETINLVAPSAPMSAEYQRMSTVIKDHVGEMTKLADIRESAARDLTMLNRATGWDARLIALAAKSERLSADADVKLQSKAVYGLLRAGLPSDKLLLAQVEPDVAEKVLKSVRDTGIVELTDQEIEQFKNDFVTFANKTRLSIPAPGSHSTYGKFLDAVKLKGDDPDKNQRDEATRTSFASLYFSHRGDASALWKKAADKGIPSEDIRALQLQGKLAFLAGNSELTTTHLMQKKIDGEQINDPVRLVEQDLYHPDKWKDEIKELAGNDDEKLKALIPAAYVGEKVEDRLDAYAEDMARKVRLSYPTQVVGRMIENNKISLSAAQTETIKLLKNAAGQGFRLGQTPVETFIKSHPGVTTKMADYEVRAAQQQMKMLACAYQITTSNEALNVLINLGMPYAFDVTAHSEIVFMELYEAKYYELYGKVPIKKESHLIYSKAKQVSSVTYNLFTIAKKLDSEPPIAGISAPVEVREEVRNKLIKQFPTMESLFGSTDFCECEHCRSVLSPAAYLVDLLQFVDPEPGTWANYLEYWRQTHNGQEYTSKYKKPYDALFERRPDLSYIPLTCENTNTALPYIDIVNEILEYYVAKGKLEQEAVQDTGEITTAELLAEPQNVINETYDKLLEAHYPLNLPFDLWIETIREFCNYFETPLAQILEVFRRSNDIFASDQPDRYNIFIESLGFSPAEADLFTDANPLGNDRWYELYGFPTIRPVIKNPTNDGHTTLTITNDDAKKLREGLIYNYFDVSANALSEESQIISTIGVPNSGGTGQTLITFEGIWKTSRPEVNDLLVCNALAMLRSAKALSRRLGVTYKEIVEIVQTEFVNPELKDLSILYKLGVKIRDARSYLDHKELLRRNQTELSTEEQKLYLEVKAFSEKLVKLAETFNVTETELENKLQTIPFNSILVLADPNSGCNFDQTILCFANGDPVNAFVFLKMNLFVRMWRKLGWSIEETDRAFQAFVPKNAPFNVDNLAKQPLKSVLIYLAHLKSLNENVSIGKQSLIKLITLWSDIPTTGKNSLYSQLFLGSSMRKNSQVFDHPLGQYLSADINLKDHVLALQGALGLTADEIKLILKDAQKSLDTAKLSLPNVSLLYRYGLFAKALKLSVSELISLKQLSGLDPFKQLHPDPLEDTPAGVTPDKKAIDFDYPFSNTLRFVEVVEKVKQSGFKIEDLEYLLLHHFDETGKYRPNKDGSLLLIKTLADGIHLINNEYSVSVDPELISDNVLKQKLGLILTSGVVERLLAMTNGTAEFTVGKSNENLKGEILNPDDFKDEPSIREVVYNETYHEQKITFRGVLFDKEKLKLIGKHPSGLFASLIDEIQNSEREFFNKYLLNYFDDYSQLFALESDEATISEIHAKLLWAFGPDLVLTKPEILADKILTDDLLDKYLDFILPPDVADTFLKMFRGKIEFTAVQKNVEPNEKLNQEFNEPYIKISYNEAQKEQKLIFQGVLLKMQSVELKKKYSSPLFGALLDEIQSQARKYYEFYEKNLLDFFSIDDFDLLFKPIPQELSEEEKQKLKRDKFTRLAKEFLLYIWVYDLKTFTPVLSQEILNLVFSPENAKIFLSMLGGKEKYTVVQKNVEPHDLLDKEIKEQYIAISYDAIQKERTFIFEGVLLDAQNAELKAKYPSQVFASLLDEVQKQARSFYEKKLQSVLAGSSFNLLFAVIPDGLNRDLKQKLMGLKKIRLIQAFMPVLQRQLTRQFILQRLTAQLGGDPALVESLVKDNRLLGDPHPLEVAFTSTAEYGLDVTFFESPDGEGGSLATLVFNDADTSLHDKKNISKPANAKCALFEGYLEVPTPRDYRFYAAFKNRDGKANSNGEVTLSFDHLPEPLLNGKAENGEISNYLELKSGILYHFKLKLSNLGDGEARFLIQSETLPKDNLSRLKLYPKTAIEHAESALVLLSKVLQIIQSFNLNEREVRYLLTHPTDFEGLNLSKLPTSKADITPEGSKALFSQFLRLAGYSSLKRDLAGGSDDLINIFETANLEKVYNLIAKLTRRDDLTVTETSRAISISSFTNELTVQQLWEAMQVVERFGVPIASLLKWTSIVNPTLISTSEQRFGIALDLKKAIKARFEPETWQRIAQPIFDKLRRLQRDALVAHVMHQHGFVRMEQLYEYFLVDPGMEPVVQTSRIRLAIASLQLFIQRCLLNMEKDVHPSAINSKQWEWMKRYRVWEANRKIFLFPENWLEPEFRDDKTYLFVELEGALLQGDVSSDLVEDAFLNYLKKLDELARLDIVAMHLEDKSDPSLRILHVIGRTYSKPHKYFYRRYAHQMWTPWEPVSADIEGDHLAPVIWHDRLFLFWVTFMDKADENAQIGSETETELCKGKLSGLMRDLKKASANKQIDMQLHWSEYLQGKWSTPESGGFAPVEGDSFNIYGRGIVFVPLTVPLDFDSRSVFIHVSVDYDAGEERGVFVHLGGMINKAFYLAGRNSSPEVKSNKDNGELGVRPTSRYSASDINATRYTGSGELKVTFQEFITTEPGKTPPSATPSVLQQGSVYTLLPCNNNLTAFDISKDAYQNAENPDAVKEAIRSGFQEIASLIKPIFYQDNEHTFFVEPNVIERTIEDWQEWIPSILQPDLDFHIPDVVEKPWEEWQPYIPDTGDPWEFANDPESLISLKSKGDWLINSGTGLVFDDVLIGPTGQVGMEILTAEASRATAGGHIAVNVNPGSGLVASSTLVLTNVTAFEKSGMMKFAGGINIVGNSGFNSALAQKFNELKSSGLDAGKLGSKLIER